MDENERMNKTYWIQEYNKPGDNWIDRIGFSPSQTQSEALGTLGSYRSTFPGDKFRLILRTDTVVDQVIKSKAYLHKNPIQWSPADVAEAIADGFYTMSGSKSPLGVALVSMSVMESSKDTDEASKLERLFAAVNNLLDLARDPAGSTFTLREMLNESEGFQLVAAMEGLE